jgi:flagellar protein FlgJ
MNPLEELLRQIFSGGQPPPMGEGGGQPMPGRVNIDPRADGWPEMAPGIPPQQAAPQQQRPAPQRPPQAGGGGWSSAAFDDMGSAGNPAVQAAMAGQGGASGGVPPMSGSAGMSARSGGSQGGGVVGGLLSGILGGGSGKNLTVQWLTEQGFDPGMATMIASDRQLLQKVIMDKAQGADPREALELQKLGLEVENMRNPNPDYITGRDGSIFQAGRDGLKQVYGGKPDQTTDIQEYQYAVQQGYKGSFANWQIEQKRAGASQVNIDQKAEGAFDKELAVKQASMFAEMSTEGMNSRADIAVIDELSGLLQGQGGTMSGIAGALAKYGIGGEGLSDIQAAQALINKLVPSQRQPGSGTMSDRDVELFTRSLPSLWNQPGGNEIILRTMRGLAEYKQAQGEIADQVMAGEITRQEARQMLRQLKNPLELFRGRTGTGESAKPPQSGGYRILGVE